METQILGIFASILVAISLSMKAMFPLRIINLVGAIAFIIYSYLICAWPVLLVNVYVAGTDIYHLYLLIKEQKLAKDFCSKYPKIS